MRRPGCCWASRWPTPGLALQTGSLGWVALFRGVKPVYPPMPVTGLFRLTRQPIYVSFTLTLWTVHRCIQHPVVTGA